MMELFWLSCTQKYIISLHKGKKLIGTVFLCLSAMTPKVLEIYFRSSEEGCSTIDGMVRLPPALWYLVNFMLQIRLEQKYLGYPFSILLFEEVDL